MVWHKKQKEEQKGLKVFKKNVYEKYLYRFFYSSYDKIIAK